MQAVILAAGASSRFYPLAENRVKDMIPLLGKTILERTIETVSRFGVKEIIVVTTPEGANTISPLRCEPKLTLVVQKKPLGMADALLTAKDLIKEDFLLLNAHHFEIGNFFSKLEQKKRKYKTVLLVTKKNNYWDYGTVKIENDIILEITEKPKKIDSEPQLCLVGVYLLPPKFIKFLSGYKPEQFQLERALGEWVKKEDSGFVETDFALTLKYPWDLFKIKDYLLETEDAIVSKSVRIAKTAQILGKVIINSEVIIMENAVIKGPVCLGKNVVVGNNSLIRGGTVLEEGVKIGAFCDVKNSIFLPGASLASGFVGSSIIGENCKLAHGFITANKRFDRKNILVTVKGKKVDTRLSDLGVIMGDLVDTGIMVATMPGKIIGSGARIGPGVIVFEDIKEKQP